MRIQQAAFKKGKPFLKGALHCHTTRSDGQSTPEEAVRLHYENGYQFMAITDHDMINHVNPCPEIPMTMLSGMEREMDMAGPAHDRPLSLHVVGVGVPGDARTPAQDTRLPHYPPSDCADDAQGMIDEMHSFGMITHYCHPEWSGTPYQEFKNLRGNYAMEVWNSGCAMELGLDTNAAGWDEALADGNPLWGVAVDDGHAPQNHCRGWVMVSADNNAESILEALQNGEFYASCGPEIYDLYMEGHTVHIKCSPVKTIQFRTLHCPLKMFTAQPGEQLTEVEWTIPDVLRYVRLVLTDDQGRRAWSNPFILR